MNHLVFDDRFWAAPLECIVWADEPTFKRVRFDLGPLVLEKLSGGENPVHHERNLAVCERKRPQIENACRRAFVRRPAGCIRLAASDFV